jgi:hypothetical protein
VVGVEFDPPGSVVMSRPFQRIPRSSGSDPSLLRRHPSRACLRLPSTDRPETRWPPCAYRRRRSNGRPLSTAGDDGRYALRDFDGPAMNRPARPLPPCPGWWTVVVRDSRKINHGNRPLWGFTKLLRETGIAHTMGHHSTSALIFRARRKLKVASHADLIETISARLR